ncbi:hypothetical protein OIM90_12205 [Streptomyces sp. AD16]|nr:hypothetical protein OIM90_12205 [Streptomyces sp. AD16]
MVKGKAARTQVVTFCQDETKASGKDVKTGKEIDGSADDPKDLHYSITVLMRESEKIDGYWRAVSIEGEQGAAECV